MQLDPAPQGAGRQEPGKIAAGFDEMEDFPTDGKSSVFFCRREKGGEGGVASPGVICGVL